jgi:hypothetical protein
MAASSHYRPPDPLKITGGAVADNWRRFKEQWTNYEIAVGIDSESAKMRAAIFLTCIGTEAYDIFRSFEFANEDDRKIKPVMDAFENYCVGAVNVTYERYVFNRRTQENGERFDAFLGDLRHLVDSYEFGPVKDSMIRD